MARRFTDTNKYKDSFIRGLQGAYKLLWDYLHHDCDHAGIWVVDFETAQIFVGKDMPIDHEEALRVFNSSEAMVVEIAGGKKWFIPSFVFEQYGAVLNPTNRVHKSVIDSLEKFGLISENKPLKSPLQGAKDMDKDKYKDKDKGKGGAGGKPKRPPRKEFLPPAAEEVAAYMAEINYPGLIQKEAATFVRYYTERDWKYGKHSTPMSNWKLKVQDWKAQREEENGTQQTTIGPAARQPARSGAKGAHSNEELGDALQQYLSERDAGAGQQQPHG